MLVLWSLIGEDGIKMVGDVEHLVVSVKTSLKAAQSAIRLQE